MHKYLFKILFLEKQKAISLSLSEFLEQHQIENYSVAMDHEFIACLNSHHPDLIILDWPLPQIHYDIVSFLETLPQTPALVLAKKTDIDAINNSELAHVHGYIKPVSNSELCKVLEHYVISAAHKRDDPVASDPSSKQLLKLALQVASYNVPVMISGESGVGKELVARYIHDHSDRAQQPFVAVNCAAIPTTMLESIMFGYEKGAFTGAIKSTPGKFEQAQHGTILLDEISEMPLELQAKLLRVIQEKEVERLGGQNTISLDVRIIATTNRNLQQEVAEGRFRMDLFYRLNVFPIHWIPLRQRPLDVIPLVEYLLAYHANLLHRPIPKLTPAAQDKLLSHSWPGNAREVDNVVQRALIIQSGEQLDAHDFYFDDFTLWQQPQPIKNELSKVHKIQSLEEQEYDLILKTLEKTLGNRTTAAKLLKISPRTLRYKIAKMRSLNIEIPKARYEPVLEE